MNISIFTSEYWLKASKEIKSLRTITFAALAIAFGIITSSLFIPVGENLRVSFTFLVLALSSMIFGPVAGLFVGAAYDILSFLVFPSSVFFPGYTLSTMLEFFIYGLFLYQSRITILRIFTAKVIVNYWIHVMLGSLWSSILFGKGYLYFLAKSIVKNTLMLPIEVIMLAALLQVFLPILIRTGVAPRQNCKHIPFI